MNLDNLPMNEHILCEVSDRIAVVRISRAERQNASTNAMYRR